MDNKILMSILGSLAKLAYFDITVHSPDDFSLIEEYYETELESDPEFLDRFNRIVECNLLLDSAEFAHLVLQLSRNKEASTKAKQYIHHYEPGGGELCIINLIRDVRRQIKKKVLKKPAGKTTTKSPEGVAEVLAQTEGDKQSVTPEKQALAMDLLIIKLNKRLKKAVEAEDYEAAVHLRNEITKLKGE